MRPPYSLQSSPTTQTLPPTAQAMQFNLIRFWHHLVNLSTKVIFGGITPDRTNQDTFFYDFEEDTPSDVESFQVLMRHLKTPSRVQQNNFLENFACLFMG